MEVLRKMNSNLNLNSNLNSNLKIKINSNLNKNHQFRKSGSLQPSVNYPWNPIIEKPESMLDKLHQKNNNKAIINQIIKSYGNILDCPMEIIRKINLSNKYELTESRKALYFKALFQETTKFYPNINLTYEHMYRKYFHNKILNNYTLTEKNFIYKCSNNNKLLIDIYKNEYIKYSKWI